MIWACGGLASAFVMVDSSEGAMDAREIAKDAVLSSAIAEATFL